MGKHSFQFNDALSSAPPKRPTKRVGATSHKIHQQFGIKATCLEPIETTLQGSTEVVLFPVSF